jgi:hypothetical protein
VSPATETTLAYWREHREQLRQSESQRSVLTNVVLVVSAGLTGFVAQQGMAAAMAPVAALIAVVGGYGALAVAKYHERAEYHLMQARALTSALVAIGELPDHGPALDVARLEHYRRHRMSSRLRLHWLWTALNVSVAAFGAVLFLIVLT